MNPRGRVLAGLSLIALGVLALDHPVLAAAFLVGAGVGALALTVRRRGGSTPASSCWVRGAPGMPARPPWGWRRRNWRAGASFRCSPGPRAPWRPRG